MACGSVTSSGCVCTAVLLVLLWSSVDLSFGFLATKSPSARPFALSYLHQRVSPKVSLDSRTASSALSSSSPQEVLTTVVEPDFLISDSRDLVNRPALQSFLFEPRNMLSLTLCAAGVAISLLNVLGIYDSTYLQLQTFSISLAFVTAFLDYRASLPPYGDSPLTSVSPNIRCGCIDDSLVHWYAGTYTAAAAWLAGRTHPQTLVSGMWDLPVGLMALVVFAFALAAPVLTLLHHYNVVSNLDGTLQRLVRLSRGDASNMPQKLPPLSETELFRAQSLLIIGVIGCIFAPEVFTLMVRGQDWWDRVSILHTGQPWIESTNALFGVYATQASMVAHRAGKRGVAPYAVIVPAFTVVCLLLTILPSAWSLYWWGDQISFFDFYTE